MSGRLDVDAIGNVLECLQSRNADYARSLASWGQVKAIYTVPWSFRDELNGSSDWKALIILALVEQVGDLQETVEDLTARIRSLEEDE